MVDSNASRVRETTGNLTEDCDDSTSEAEVLLRQTMATRVEKGVCVCVLFLSGTYITRSDVQHVASLRGLAAPLNYQVTETI